jgi:hypothetical protein
MNTRFTVFASYNILQYLCDFIHVLIFVTVSKCRKSPKSTNTVQLCTTNQVDPKQICIVKCYSEIWSRFGLGTSFSCTMSSWRNFCSDTVRGSRYQFVNLLQVTRSLRVYVLLQHHFKQLLTDEAEILRLWICWRFHITARSSAEMYTSKRPIILDQTLIWC